MLTATVSCVRGIPLGAQPVLSAGRPVISVLSHDWQPATPIGSDSLRIERVAQQAIPLSMRLGGWSQLAGLDLSAAYARSTVTARNRAGQVQTLHLDGPTDVRGLLTISLFDEHAALLLGGTVPVGQTKLTGEQLAALGAVGAPAVGAPVPVFGSGGTGNAGVTASVQLREWTLTMGGGYEYRFRYVPIGQLSPTLPLDATLAPGPSLSLSGRLRGEVAGTGIVADLGVRQFKADTFSLATRVRSSRVVYRLGALSNVGLRVTPSILRARDLTLTLARTARAPYEVQGLGPVTDSDASQLSVTAAMTLLRLGRVRAAAGLEARRYSGIRSDSTLVAAQFGEQVASVAVVMPIRMSELMFSAAISSGTITLRERPAVGMRRLILKGQIYAL